MRQRQTSRYRNSLGLPAITAILIVVASLALVGLGIVISKNRVRALGEEQRKVEDDIRLLRSEITKLEQSREKAFTSVRVQPRLTKAATLLQPLVQNRILILKPTQAPASAAALPDATPVAKAIAQTTPPPP